MLQILLRNRARVRTWCVCVRVRHVTVENSICVNPTILRRSAVDVIMIACTQLVAACNTSCKNEFNVVSRKSFMINVTDLRSMNSLFIQRSLYEQINFLHTREKNMVARWKVVLGVVTLLGVSMSLSQSTVLKSKAAGLVLHMRDAPISGGAIYLAVSVLITISGRQ